MKSNFSVVAICRNEEKTIGRFINSLKEFLDQGGNLVIVDTGSFDNTVAVAKAMNVDLYLAGDQFRRIITEDEAKLINQEFVVGEEQAILKVGDTLFDFASARNYAASFAENDWIAMHDIDETYSQLNIDKINEIIDNQELDNLEYEFVFAHDQFGVSSIQFIQSKFYRKSKLEWRGIVHECLFPIKI